MVVGGGQRAAPAPARPWERGGNFWVFGGRRARLPPKASASPSTCSPASPPRAALHSRAETETPEPGARRPERRGPIKHASSPALPRFDSPFPPARLSPCSAPGPRARASRAASPRRRRRRRATSPRVGKSVSARFLC